MHGGMDTRPRFTLSIFPRPSDGQTEAVFTATAGDVTYAEVLPHLLRAAQVLAQSPGTRVEPESEVAEKRRRAKILAENPVTTLLVRATEQAWLSDAGMAIIGNWMLTQGWKPVAVPPGMSKLCDYLDAPDAFQARYGTATSAESADAPPAPRGRRSRVKSRREM